MRDDDNPGETIFNDPPEKSRKSGRPTVIPASLSGVVAELYRLGYGYRAVATFLASEYRLNATTVR